MRKIILFLTLFLGLSLGLAAGVFGQCSFNGSITSGDATHNDALNTSGVNSTVTTPQVCPGIFTTTGAIHYDRYDFVNSNAVNTDYEVTANATGCTAERAFLFGGAYLGSFEPANLCGNYLASMGMGHADLGTYSFTVPAGSLFSLIVEEFDPNVACAAYTITITPCPNVAPSPTATGTPTSGTINGTVTYGNAIPAATRFVSNVLISGAGSPNVSTTTGFPSGTYTLTGFGAGSYTITPSKTGAANGSITSFDAARIAQHAAGGNPLTGNQLIVADVSSNGTISSFDAGQLARYVVGTPPFGTTSNWLFTPVSNLHSSVTGSINGEDYSALLMGEVSGNWSDNGTRPVGSRQLADGSDTERGPSVSLPTLTTPADYEVVVPVNIEGVAEKGVIAYEFDLRYDPTVLQPQKNAAELAGTISRAMSVVTNGDEAGLLRVAVYGANELKDNGVLLNLKFNAVGTAGSVSPLAFERIILNEGDPLTTATNGHVELSAAAPNQAELTGRLFNSTGDGIPNARVTLSDTTGKSLSIISNSFGYYRFGNLQVGQTYTISVESRGWEFFPLTVSVIGETQNFDLIAQ